MDTLPTAVTDTAHTIQLAVAPVFLLAGVAGFLNMLAGRLARVVDRSRKIIDVFTPVGHPEHDQQVWELRVLDRRIGHINRAIFLCTASAVAICLVVAGLFIAALAGFNGGRIMAFAFILAMGLLVLGLGSFLLESRLAIVSLRVSVELLEREATSPKK